MLAQLSNRARSKVVLAVQASSKSHLSTGVLSRRHSTGHGPSSGGITDPAKYCRDLVRERDYEAFLISQFWTANLRDGFFALRAFYIELASVQETVSNAMIGNMRIQFWRDAVKSMSDDRPPHHPIALALHSAHQKANLQAYHLKRIVDAREVELENPTHLTVDSLTAHAESTSSTFLYLLVQLLNQSSDHSLSHAASHLGAAHGIFTLLRALPYHTSQSRSVIPAEITARHGVSQEDVFRRGGAASGISDAVFEFATLANDHLATSLEMFKDVGERVPEVARPAFLFGAPTRLYLERLQEANFDAFEPKLRMRDWKLPWRIWRSYHKGMY